ncbi:uncharacterized protein [Palaemon carinicauda]|uniref:uncharacterized protein n=1 Tax=Palaemon carinicauda TaxID=392227 RepID=UPI0035B5F9E0
MSARRWLFVVSALAAITSSASAESRPASESLAQALLDLESALNGTNFCYSRIKSLWAAAAERKIRLDEMQDAIFLSMNKLAKLEASSPMLKECPAPFKKVAGGCFHNPEEKLKKWTDARLACGKLGGDLAYPRDLDAFRQWAGGLRSDYGYYYLGGRSDPDKEFPEFRWVDGRRILKEEKYRTEFLVISDMFCITMENQSRKEIKNKGCDDHKRWYICEIKIKENK